VHVGRKPYSEGLGLEKVGLKVDARGFLRVDSSCARASRTSTRSATSPAADARAQGQQEGLVAAAVIAGQKDEYDARCVPAVIFTAPEMASVGLLEDEAKKQGREIASASIPFAANGPRSR
jgi:dihydrolipoamide dehydrogenase